MKWLVLVLLAGSVGLVAGKCGEIVEHGISEEGRKVVVEMHNKYRKMIANGEVPGQPRGIDLLRLSYDEKLEKGSKDVSMTCTFEHFVTPDSRWQNVGQNLYGVAGLKEECSHQNWTAVVDAWYNEYVDFDYNGNNNKFLDIGHYTQVVWADTCLVGCDFICFYDKDQNPKYPYYKMYSCNYGPSGNYAGQWPYETGIGGCEDLC